MARRRWAIAAGLVALVGLGGCGDDGESELPPRAPQVRRPGVPHVAIGVRSPGAWEGGGRLPGDDVGRGDGGRILGGDPRRPPVRATDMVVDIPGATLPALPGEPPERFTRRGHPGTTLPALPADRIGGDATPVSPSVRGDDRERAFLAGILSAHTRMLADAEACAESATDADLVAVCRYLAEARRGEMEWLLPWLGERVEAGSTGR